MNHRFYHQLNISSAASEKKLALLIDPDKYTDDQLAHIMQLVNDTACVDMVFVGGSLLTNNRISECISVIRTYCNLPVILFPGSPAQVNDDADGLLLLSLISGRNADLLIGRHVEAAPFLKQSSLEIMPTGYILVDGGKPTTVSYISNTLPIPANKPDIAACTAMAGELLGLKIIYLDCGSGALHPVPMEMITTVRKSVNLPIIVGGGICTPMQLAQCWEAGADIAVIGNVLEKEPELLYRFSEVSKLPAREMKSN